jgi:ubiquinol-cytochrome c reductase iron-sulfur subunit
LDRVDGVRWSQQPHVAGTELAGRLFLSCHGSKYDLAGRVYHGVPAPDNLPVPPHHFLSDTMLRVGENPPNSNFEFGSIRQI